MILRNLAISHSRKRLDKRIAWSKKYPDIRYLLQFARILEAQWRVNRPQPPARPCSWNPTKADLSQRSRRLHDAIHNELTPSDNGEGYAF